MRIVALSSPVKSAYYGQDKREATHTIQQYALSKDIFRVSNKMLLHVPDSNVYEYKKLTIHLDNGVVHECKENEWIQLILTMEKKNVCSDFDINIVYFINTLVNNTTYLFLMKAQLTHLLSTGLMEHAHLYIECCGTDPQFIFHVENIMSSQRMHNITVNMHPENNHEYFGIHRVWQLHQDYTGDPHHHITLYFHSKGISHYTFTKENAYPEYVKKIFDKVIVPWEKVLSIFEKEHHIDKIGYAYHPCGFIWYNFWWVRGSYCRKLERPIRTDRRHYYEDYIGRQPRDQNNPIFQQTERLETPNTHEWYHISCENCYGLVIPHPCCGEEVTVTLNKSVGHNDSIAMK